MSSLEPAVHTLNVGLLGCTATSDTCHRLAVNLICSSYVSGCHRHPCKVAIADELDCLFLRGEASIFDQFLSLPGSFDLLCRVLGLVVGHGGHHRMSYLSVGGGPVSHVSHI